TATTPVVLPRSLRAFVSRRQLTPLSRVRTITTPCEVPINSRSAAILRNLLDRRFFVSQKTVANSNKVLGSISRRRIHRLDRPLPWDRLTGAKEDAACVCPVQDGRER